MNQRVNGFCTYIHIRRDSGQVFYVGKGRLTRPAKRSGRNPRWRNVVNKHGFAYLVLACWDNEDDAFKHEKYLIAAYRSMGAPLVNMTDGGDGVSNPCIETRQKQSAALKGKLVGGKSPKAKKVICLETGIVFAAVRDAVRYLKDNGFDKAASTSISRACANSNYTAHGFTWSYLTNETDVSKCHMTKKDLENAKEIRDRNNRENLLKAIRTKDTSRTPRSGEHSNAKAVCCIESGLRFDAISDAVKWLIKKGFKRASGCHISACCKGKRPVAYGHTWKYA